MTGNWEERNVYHAFRDGWDDGRGGYRWRHGSLYGGLAARVYTIAMDAGHRTMIRAYLRRIRRREKQRLKGKR